MGEDNEKVKVWMSPW